MATLHFPGPSADEAVARVGKGVWPYMRSFIVGITLLVLLAPWAGQADGEKKLSRRQDCRRITRQIAHFEGTVLEMARERNDELWQQATSDHISRLKNRRADRCPEYAEERRILARAKKQADQMKRLMVAAAKGAAKYFSGGLY